MTDLPKHELHTFLVQDLAEMQSEYERIRARTLEDPGTAGDEGEEVWAGLLRSWLPDHHQVRTKGRILAADGTAGPQVDVVVLNPGYPQRLIDKKLYLAGGVTAAFECKNTLTAADIRKTWLNVQRINKLEGAVGIRTPRTDLVPNIFYGLLASGHSWTKPRSNPMGVISSTLQALLYETTLMRDCLSLVCVANLASWDILRITYDGPGLVGPELWQARRKLFGLESDEPTCSIQYNMASANSDEYRPSNPLGVLVSNLVGRIAMSDKTLVPLAQYFNAVGLGGLLGMPVTTRRYPLQAQLSEDVRVRLPYSLTNGEWGSDWAMGFHC